MQYAVALLVFNLLGALAVYGLQRLQAILPLNPASMAAVSPDSSFNTAVSFATNTNWQGYGGESTMSYLTQMLALTVQNFVSAATGMAVLVALIRGFARQNVQTHRQLLGRPDAHHAVHPAAAVAGARAGARVAGRGADLLRLSDRAAGGVGRVRQSQARRRRPAAQGRQGQSGHREGDAEGTGDRRRPGRLADRDQAARHQRRRLLQRQLGASVREPDAAFELPRGAGHPADPGGAVLHLRRWWATRARAGRFWRR